MPVSVGTYHGPSCWQKVKSGLFAGFCVGVVSGLLFGGISSYRIGFRGKELVTSMGKTMLQGGGTFATFMAIGSAIRFAIHLSPVFGYFCYLQYLARK